MAWNKFSARRTELNGRSFASGGERGCYEYLLALEKTGEIGKLQCQVSVYLTNAKILYKPDFKFWCYRLNREVYAEYKGFETPEWRIKRRLWIHYGPGPLRIYKGRFPAIALAEELIPK